MPDRKKVIEDLNILIDHFGYNQQSISVPAGTVIRHVSVFETLLVAAAMLEQDERMEDDLK